MLGVLKFGSCRGALADAGVPASLMAFTTLVEARQLGSGEPLMDTVCATIVLEVILAVGGVLASTGVCAFSAWQAGVSVWISCSLYSISQK